jgi:hypothetical protein
MTIKRLLALVVTVTATAIAIGLWVPPESAAQGCAMCYQSASAAGPHAIQALRTGIIVLMVPPAFICIGITWLAWRRRNLHNQSS